MRSPCADTSRSGNWLHQIPACYPYIMTLVEIRPVARSDATELIRSNVASRAYHEPWLRAFTDSGGFDAWFSGLISGANVGLIAREVASGGVIGIINLSEISLKNFQSAYLGYYGMVNFSGRGLMKEAIRKVAHYAFTEVGLHRLEASIQPANIRSIELIKRIGFRREGFSPRYLRINGVWCDHEHWALLSDEPLLQRSIYLFMIKPVSAATSTVVIDPE